MCQDAILNDRAITRASRGRKQMILNAANFEPKRVSSYKLKNWLPAGEARYALSTWEPLRSILYIFVLSELQLKVQNSSQKCFQKFLLICFSLDSFLFKDSRFEMLSTTGIFTPSYLPFENGFGCYSCRIEVSAPEKMILISIFTLVSQNTCHNMSNHANHCELWRHTCQALVVVQVRNSVSCH